MSDTKMLQFTRRGFLAGAAALCPAFGTASWASSTPVFKYSPGVIEDALRNGRTVIVTYHAFWCSVCKRQERVIQQIRESSPDYDRLFFVNVDWDEYRDLPIALDRQVYNRSTILTLQGEAEIERVVAATSRRKLTELLDNAVLALRSNS